MGDIFKLIAKLTCAISAMALLLVSTGASAAPPEVVTVPWRGNLDLPHEIFDGKQVYLKGIARDVTTASTATWTFGDGSPPIAITVNPNPDGVDYDLGVLHTYPNSAPGTPFTAVLEVCNGSECASDTYRLVVRAKTIDVEINVAIDEGLWYLHRQQIRDTSTDDGRFPWSNSYSRDAMVTASAVQAFQINNHFQTNSDATDPYADTVRRGLNYMFSRLVTVQIGAQLAGNPDTNGNGLGVTVGNTATPPYGVGAYPIYQTGQIMDAVVTSKTPNEPVPSTSLLAALTSPSGAPAYTYFDAVQDMVDVYAWGQVDTAWPRGGWRYNFNSSSDNSAAQWAAIGILAARDLFGATVPKFVYSENLIWLDYSRHASNIGYGYTSRGSGSATTPSGLVQLVMNGIPRTDIVRWKTAEDYLATVWNSWYANTNDYYRLFALAKAMRLALPSPIIIMGSGAATIDWFKDNTRGVARTIMNDQDWNGRFTGSYRVSNTYRHAWGIIILTGTLQLEPVAVAKANPNPGADGVPVNFDGSASFHQDPAKNIVAWEWDFDNDNVYDASGETVSHTFNCASLPCTYPVTLKVTDDSTPAPLVDTDSIVVEITNPPHPPTSDPNGPYMMCVEEEATFDGSGSFDIDEPLGDSITAYDWEFDFVAPFDFADGSGVAPSYAFTAPGLKNIGLRVTDDSSTVFGGPDLTDDGFTTAMVTTCDCVGPISVRSKDGKNQLVWSPVAGAASYDVYRSTTGPWSGFSLVADDHVTTYATYLDSGLTNGVTYWYRVTPIDGSGEMMCGSDDVSGTPTARTVRRR